MDINCDDTKWNMAIEMFVNRFEERYFRPIDVLMENKEANGFAIMAMNCLLVDAFYQFETGDSSTTNNSQKYSNFLKTHLASIILDSDMARLFIKI